MWFKNLQIFKLAEAFPYTAEEFSEKLEQNQLHPCARTQLFSEGWVSPFGRHSPVMVHAANNCFLFALSKEEKLLPASVIKQALDDKVDEIEERDQHQLSRKQKLNLREEVVFSLLPQAFIKRKTEMAYIDVKNNLLIVDTSSRSRAEELTELLRRTLGSLKLSVLKTNARPSLVMSKWLLDNRYPVQFMPEDNCEMLDLDDGTGVIKCSQQDLFADEVLVHLRAGKKISRLALQWSDKISFVFNDDLSVKRIKFLDLIRDNHDAKAETKAEQIDADFILMVNEFAQMLSDLFGAFDGLVDEDAPTMSGMKPVAQNVIGASEEAQVSVSTTASKGDSEDSESENIKETDYA